MGLLIIKAKTKTIIFSYYNKVIQYYHVMANGIDTQIKYNVESIIYMKLKEKGNFINRGDFSGLE